jgi:hypothetical protein
MALCESGIRHVCAVRASGNLYRSNRSVKKQKAGVRAPAFVAR